VPNQSKRVAWQREGGQCGLVEAHALGGPATPDNIGLRCRRHNQYEAEKVFGPRRRE